MCSVTKYAQDFFTYSREELWVMALRGFEGMTDI